MLERLTEYAYITHAVYEIKHGTIHACFLANTHTYTHIGKSRARVCVWSLCSYTATPTHCGVAMTMCRSFCGAGSSVCKQLKMSKPTEPCATCTRCGVVLVAAGKGSETGPWPSNTWAGSKRTAWYRHRHSMA